MPICPPAGSDGARRAGPTAPGDERQPSQQPSRVGDVSPTASWAREQQRRHLPHVKRDKVVLTVDPNAPGALISQTFDGTIRGYGWWRRNVGAALLPPTEVGRLPTPPPPSVGPRPVRPTTKQLPAHQREALVRCHTRRPQVLLSPSLGDRCTPASPRRPRGT